MRTTSGLGIAAVAILSAASLSLTGCEPQQRSTGGQRTASGVQVAADTTDVETGTDGLTNEQRLLERKRVEESQIGRVTHVYCVSTYTGDVLFYQTVEGKLVSGGKRLLPKTVASGKTGGEFKRDYGVPIRVRGLDHRTSEVMDADGTFGSSNPYFFAWSTAGNYFKVSPMGGVMLVESSVPLSFPPAILNMDASFTAEGMAEIVDQAAAAAEAESAAAGG